MAINYDWLVDGTGEMKNGNLEAIVHMLMQKGLSEEKKTLIKAIVLTLDESIKAFLKHFQAVKEEGETDNG